MNVFNCLSQVLIQYRTLAFAGYVDNTVKLFLLSCLCLLNPKDKAILQLCCVRHFNKKYVIYKTSGAGLYSCF